jgi:quercetin dioxygenase-like cupin family protein
MCTFGAMRSMITGIDAEGRSCIAEEAEVVPTPVDGFSGLRTAALFHTEQSPPPARPAALAGTVDVQLPPGLVRWMIVEHEPHATLEGPTGATTMHHTDTLDFVFVQRGSAEFLLQDGAHEVTAGDHVVTTGVDHAWRAGDDGCRLLVVSIGTPTPS